MRRKKQIPNPRKNRGFGMIDAELVAVGTIDGSSANR
jgi:hypothetical protein